MLQYFFKQIMRLKGFKNIIINIQIIYLVVVSDIIAAVRATIGMFFILGSSDFLMILVASIPSSTGICKSIRIRSKSSFARMSRAICPFSACVTVIPQPIRNLLATKKFILLSSATSILLPSSPI